LFFDSLDIIICCHF